MSPTLADIIEGAALIDTISFAKGRCTRGSKVTVTLPQLQKGYAHPLVEPAQESEYDFPYLCDTVTEGGGWIVIQRRTKGDTNFNRSWNDYKNGFGELDSDFWLGLDKMHTITATGRWELKVTLKTSGKEGEANYRYFTVGPENRYYALWVGGYIGNTGDSLSYHNGQAFSTYDRDMDSNWKSNCAAREKSGFWFNNCSRANINAAFGANNGMTWRTFAGKSGLVYSEMKIRRTDV